jgi:hypothetical protein
MPGSTSCTMCASGSATNLAGTGRR